ncbi:MAG: hypothetical protein IPN69_13580 [Acidobacteria bacterium]|nr:hypothetical protein [Acidobacteriota bacterium]
MYLISAAFVTADEGWVMTESQTEDRSRRYSLFRTNDGGCSWNSIWASRRSSDLAQVTQLKFIDDRHGWFSTRLENRIFRTDDGGRKWHPIQIPSAAREIAAFDFVSPDNGWIFFFSDENDPLYFETRNGGRSWKKFGAEILQQSLLNAISKPVPSDDVRLSVVEYAVRIRSVLERNQ